MPVSGPRTYLIASELCVGFKHKNNTMKPTLIVACISWKSAWQALLLRSALTALLLAPLGVLHAADTSTPPLRILL